MRAWGGGGDGSMGIGMWRRAACLPPRRVSTPPPAPIRVACGASGGAGGPVDGVVCGAGGCGWWPSTCRGVVCGAWRSTWCGVWRGWWGWWPSTWCGCDSIPPPFPPPPPRTGGVAGGAVCDVVPVARSRSGAHRACRHTAPRCNVRRRRRGRRRRRWQGLCGRSPGAGGGGRYVQGGGGGWRRGRQRTVAVEAASSPASVRGRLAAFLPPSPLPPRPLQVCAGWRRRGGATAWW
jgi:hypothetical protein